MYNSLSWTTGRSLVCKVSKRSRQTTKKSIFQGKNSFKKKKKIHYNVSCSHLYLNTIMATIEKETIKSICISRSFILKFSTRQLLTCRNFLLSLLQLHWQQKYLHLHDITIRAWKKKGGVHKSKSLCKEP